MNKIELLNMNDVEIVELLKGNETVSTSNGYDDNLKVNRSAIVFILSDEELTKKYVHLINKSCFEDSQIMLNASRERLSALELLSSKLKNDKYFFKMLSYRDVFGLKFASDELKNSEELVDILTRKKNSELQYASIELRKDPNFIYKLVKSCPVKLDYLEDTLKENVEFIVSVAKLNPQMINTQSITKGTVLKVIKRQPVLYRFLNDSYKEDYDVFNIAFESLPLNFCRSPDKFKDDISLLRRLRDKKEKFKNTTVMETWFSEMMDKLSSLEEKEWMQENSIENKNIKPKIKKF